MRGSGCRSRRGHLDVAHVVASLSLLPLLRDPRPLRFYNHNHHTMSERLSQVSGHLSGALSRGLLAGEVAIITGTRSRLVLSRGGLLAEPPSPRLGVAAY